MNNKKVKSLTNAGKVAAVSLVAGSLLTVPAGIAGAEELTTFRSLGTGAELRSTILSNKPAGTPTPTDKTGEGKCGEGKCG